MSTMPTAGHPSFDGSPVVTVRLTATQAALIATALSLAVGQFEDPQREELALLVGCFEDASKDADSEATYGFCL